MTARVAWVDFDHFDGPVGSRCNAPRHRGQGYQAKWVMIVIDPNDDYGYGQGEALIQGMCDDCMGQIASDLGTTPELGALPYPKD